MVKISSAVSSMPWALRGRTVRMEGSEVIRFTNRVYRNSTRSTS
jgi:hypothetical protein